MRLEVADNFPFLLLIFVVLLFSLSESTRSDLENDQA